MGNGNTLMEAGFTSLVLDTIENNINSLHNQHFVNRRTTTGDTKEAFSQVLAKILLENLEKLEEISIINKKTPYDIKESDLKIGWIYSDEKKDILKDMYNKNYNTMGKVLEYQMPIEDNTLNSKNLDLLTLNDENLYLIEYKLIDTKDTLIKGILDIFTFYKNIDINRLLSDFNIPKDISIHPTLLIHKNSNIYDELLIKDSKVIELIEKLKVKILIIQGDKINKAMKIKEFN